MISGIDISNHQATANFAAIRRAGYRFCIHKATESNDFVDRYLVARWPEMKANDIKRGCYHFARPSANSPATEAAHFVTTVVDLLEPGDSVYLDIEDEYVPVGDNLSDWCLDWLRLVEQALGVRPCLYTYPSYVGERGLNVPALGSYPLWWASYSATMRPAPWPWPEVAIWQWSSNGSVPGLTGRIDMNYLLSDDINDFVKLGMPSMIAAEVAGDWTGVVTGKDHWGGDPLPVARRSDRLYRVSDGFDLSGFVLDEWQENATEMGQLVRD